MCDLHKMLVSVKSLPYHYLVMGANGRKQVKIKM